MSFPIKIKMPDVRQSHDFENWLPEDLGIWLIGNILTCLASYIWGPTFNLQHSKKLKVNQLSNSKFLMIPMVQARNLSRCVITLVYLIAQERYIVKNIQGMLQNQLFPTSASCTLLSISDSQWQSLNFCELLNPYMRAVCLCKDKSGNRRVGEGYSQAEAWVQVRKRRISHPREIS